MHTTVTIFILVELLLSFREYPNRLHGVIGLFIFNICYIIWIHIVHYKSARWVYPILGKLDSPMRIFLILIVCIAGTIYYFIGEFLNNKYWAKELEQRKSKNVTEIPTPPV